MYNKIIKGYEEPGLGIGAKMKRFSLGPSGSLVPEIDNPLLVQRGLVSYGLAPRMSVEDTEIIRSLLPSIRSLLTNERNLSAITDEEIIDRLFSTRHWSGGKVSFGIGGVPYLSISNPLHLRDGLRSYGFTPKRTDMEVAVVQQIVPKLKELVGSNQDVANMTDRDLIMQLNEGVIR